MRRAARIDENQPGIVNALRSIGASVQTLHDVGDGCPDLLVGWQGRNYLIEVKNPAKPNSDQRLTPEQDRWHIEWRGGVSVARTVEDALAAIGAMPVANPAIP